MACDVDDRGRMPSGPGAMATAAVYDEANSPVVGCSFHPSFLDKCKRVTADRAGEIHPRLMRFLLTWGDESENPHFDPEAAARLPESCYRSTAILECPGHENFAGDFCVPVDPPEGFDLLREAVRLSNVIRGERRRAKSCVLVSDYPGRPTTGVASWRSASGVRARSTGPSC